MPYRLPFRSLTRLVVGGVLSGLDLLSEKLEIWENQAAQTPASSTEAAPARSQPLLPETTSTLTLPPDADRQPESSVAQQPAIVVPLESNGDRLTHLLTGMLFSGQDRLGQYTRLTGRAARLVGNWADLVGGPVYNSRIMSPVRQRLDALSERGQETVENWLAVGRIEAENSRRLAGQALTERVGTAIDYLTANNEVQELVQSQSAGLIDEVIEEARERTVSADNFLEAMVRSMLRRPPRWELPEPPPEVRQQAEQTVRQIHGRTIRK